MTLTDIQLSIDCMPSVPADPLDGTFTAIYSNAGPATTSLDVLQANLHFVTATSSLYWTFAVTPQTQDVAGGTTVTVQLRKTPGSGFATGTGNLCDLCGMPATLLLDVLRDHALIVGTAAPIVVPCLQ